MTPKRILGVDYGDVRTGLAMSDLLCMTAVGLKTIKAEKTRILTEEIQKVIEENGVTEIVVGDPVNMNGSRGERSQHAKEFACHLQRVTKLPVYMIDERCTTMLAHTFLNETDTRGKKRKAVIDTLSAEIILQNYMDYRRQHPDENGTVVIKCE